jgi:acetyl esterase/lipase
MEWAYLALSAVGLACAACAVRPIYAHSVLAIASRFAGWPTSELPIQGIILSLTLLGALAVSGALRTWPGEMGAMASATTCVLLVLAYRRIGRARGVMQEAVGSAFGSSYGGALAAEARAWAEASVRRIQLVLPTSGDPRIETLRDIPFEPREPTLMLDVHRPRGAQGEGPILIHLHGGAWMAGGRRYQGLPLMRHLARLGWRCFSVDYRLSPRATFPDHLIDVKRAIAFVRQHGAEYGGDTGFIAIAGTSAGGHLAALAALTPNEAEYQPGFAEADTRVDACIPFDGIYDFLDRHDQWPNPMIRLVLERFVMKAKRGEAREAFDKASPFSRAREDAPPFLVVHGDCDSMVTVNEARRFVEELRARSRAPVAYAEIPGAQHAFTLLPSVRTVHVVRGAAAFLAWAYSASRTARASP